MHALENIRDMIHWEYHPAARLQQSSTSGWSRVAMWAAVVEGSDGVGW